MGRRNKLGVSRRGSKWQARPWIRGEGHVYIASNFETEDEAREASLAKIAELRRLPKSRETCDSFAGRWVCDYPRPKQSTNDLNRGAVTKFGSDFEGVLLRDVDRPAARRWAMDNRSRLGSVRAMFGDAQRDGFVGSNPFSSLRIPKGRGRKDIIVLSREELHALAETAAEYHGKIYGPTMRAIILFAAYTGIRPSELYGLEWDDLDFANETIDVRRQRYKGTEQTPKTDRSRLIILPPPAAEALRQMPRRADRPHVFCTPKGKPFTQSTLYTRWDPVRIKFGRPELDFYDLRHFCATYLRFTLGLDSWIVGHQLGHRSGQLVDDLYGHPDEALAREKIRQAFRGPVPLRVVDGRKSAARSG